MGNYDHFIRSYLAGQNHILDIADNVDRHPVLAVPLFKIEIRFLHPTKVYKSPIETTYFSSMADEKLVKLAQMVHKILPNFAGIGRKEELVIGFLNATFPSARSFELLIKNSEALKNLLIDIETEGFITVPFPQENVTMTFTRRNGLWCACSQQEY